MNFKLVLLLFLNCYIVVRGYYFQLPLSTSTTTESSLIYKPESHHSVPNHEFLNILAQNQVQKLSEVFEPSLNASLDTDDCVRQQQLRGSTKPFSVSSSMDSAQQLEQFIMSIKPNMTDSLQQQSIQHLDDKIDDNMLEQEVEVDLFKKHPFNRERMKQEYFNSKGIENVSNNDKPRHVKAAVLTRYSMEYRPIDSNMLEQELPEQRIIEVVPNGRPLQIHFKSPMNQIKVLQSPIEQQQKIEPEIERSEDEPRKFFHQIKKPIIQEVHEIIMPYRKVIQEIQPVVEQIHTIVSSSSSSGPKLSKSRIEKIHPDNRKMNLNNNRFSILTSQHLEQPQQDSEDSTLSPLLMGIEQKVEPIQQTPQHRVRKFIKVMPVMNEMKYFTQFRMPNGN